MDDCPELLQLFTRNMTAELPAREEEIEEERVELPSEITIPPSGMPPPVTDLLLSLRGLPIHLICQLSLSHTHTHCSLPSSAHTHYTTQR